MRYGSLFTGIGGFDLGLDLAGMAGEWQCEIDAPARGVLERHWPNTPRHTDVKELPLDRLSTVDVLCGGFPCQDVSVAGRRSGLAGSRSGLFHEFMRVVAAVAPGWVVVENVPGLLSSGHGRSCIPNKSKCPGCSPGADMATVLGTLAQLGYGWAYRVLDAQYFGVAQRRRRVFIVGCIGGAAERAAKVLFDPESCSGDPAPSRVENPRIAGTLAASAGSGSYGGVGISRNSITSRLVEGEVVTALTGALGSGGPDDTRAQAGWLLPDAVSTLQHRLDHGIDAEGAAGGHLLPVARPLDARERWNARHETFVPVGFHLTQDPISSPDQAPALGSESTAGVAFGQNQRGELVESDYARALSTGGGAPGQGYPAVRIGMGVRRLTPLECERLQGFPDGWTAGQPDAPRYRQLGNAVCVPVARWIGRRILYTERGQI